MKDRKAATGRPERRTFLMGLLTGAGVATALAGAARSNAGTTTSAPAPRGDTPPAPILYRRTPEVERYYRTLYYS
jgi:hypothetical protein